MKTNANSLTGSIIDYIRMTGNHAERVNNISRQVKTKYGGTAYVPSAGFRGTADIHAVKRICWHGEMVYGQFYAIEIKIGRDSLSEAQKYYGECVTKAGGVYMVVHTFDEFLEQWEGI